MAQVGYGAVYNGPPEAAIEHREDEGSALLGAAATPKKEQEGHAGLTSSIGNLANTIIGSGTPFFFAFFGSPVTRL